MKTLTAQARQEIILLGLAVEGNEQADGGLITATSGLVIGEVLTGEKIQDAIRRLWELGVFSDIKIIAEQATPEGVYLLIRVAEYPRLEFVDITGGKKLDKDEVEEAIDLFPGQILRPSETVKIRRKLEEHAEEKGYLLVDIDVRITDGSEENRKILTIKIEEGEKVKIKEIDFVGNNVFSDRKLRGQLDNTKERNLWLFRTGSFNRDEFEQDLENLVTFYRENGYRDIQVLSDSIYYSDERTRMFIDIKLNEGVKYYFGEVEFAGDILFTEAELRSRLLFERGEEFNQKKYDLTVHERLGTLYYDRGYIYAQIQPTEIPAEGDTLDILFTITPNNQFSVNQIHITGNNKTREKVIRREFVLKPGDTFNVSKLRRSIRDVVILNYFADVQPDVEDISNEEVNLWIKVEEKPTDQANVSAGYSEQDGLIGAIGFTAPNLFGTGQQASFDWNFGREYGSFSISYTEPWLFNREMLAGVSFYNVKRAWADGFTEDLIGGSLRFGKRFEWPDDYFRGSWTYRVERTKYSDFSDAFAAREDVTIEDGEVRVSSSLTQAISRDSRDFPEFPTEGSVTSLTNELAGTVLGGDDEYHKHIFSTEWFTKLFPKLVFYNQFLCAYMSGFGNGGETIPLLEYFYMGGSGLSLGTPLRGYAEQSVGPPSATTSRVIGGKTQLKLSTEMRLKFVDNPTIYGLVFAEAGNTWLDFEHTDPFDLKRSVGMGIRLYMPLVGMIGFDYGYGIDYYNSQGLRDGQWKPHFQFGRQF